MYASKCLAQQCSNSQDVKDVLQHFFDILNGKLLFFKDKPKYLTVQTLE